jgi:hypothetical protein
MPNEPDSYLEERFPKLKGGLYETKSPRDPRYNCFAFAANDTHHVWQYTGPDKLGGYFWPNEVKGDTIEHLLRVYELLGFVVCDTTDLEPDVVKIAIYVDEDGAPSHAARQTRRGTWMSKLGKRGKDIEHETLNLLEGNQNDEYGTVERVMKRRRYAWEDADEVLQQ